MNYEEALAQLKNTSPLRITISGDIGAGKSTFAKRLTEELNVPRIYAGQIFREEAKRRGLSLEEFGELSETDESVDYWLDQLMKKKSRELERGIFEGRVAGFFVENPDARVFLKVDPETAVERIWQDQDNRLRSKHDSIEGLRQAELKRRESEESRYKKYYNIDIGDEKNYDVVINTAKMSIDEVFEQTMVAIAKFTS